MDDSISSPSLYELEVSVPATEKNKGPVLVHALEGFIDAGRTVEQFTKVMKEQKEYQLLASFDSDEMFDYRARRPTMRMSGSKIISADMPKLELYAIKDDLGQPLLFLCGNEPDFKWQRFTAAIEELCELFGVSKVIGVHAVPTGVPHTRPVIINAHSNDPQLIDTMDNWDADFSFPGSISSFLDFTLGKKGFETIGLAVHIPHYLQQMEYPEGTRAVLMEINHLAGVQFNTDKVAREAAIIRESIDRHIIDNQEVQALIAGLEKQYDTYVDTQVRKRALLAEESELPSGEEIAGELEKFLATLDKKDDSTEEDTES